MGHEIHTQAQLEAMTLLELMSLRMYLIENVQDVEARLSDKGAVERMGHGKWQDWQRRANEVKRFLTRDLRRVKLEISKKSMAKTAEKQESWRVLLLRVLEEIVYPLYDDEALTPEQDVLVEAIQDRFDAEAEEGGA